MGTFLKEKLNAKGALREDKRHIFLFLLLEPLQAWRGCLLGGGGVCSTDAAGGWGGTKELCPSCRGSSVQQRGFLLRSLPQVPGPKGGLAGQDHEL